MSRAAILWTGRLNDVSIVVGRKTFPSRAWPRPSYRLVSPTASLLFVGLLRQLIASQAVNLQGLKLTSSGRTSCRFEDIVYDCRNLTCQAFTQSLTGSRERKVVQGLVDGGKEISLDIFMYSALLCPCFLNPVHSVDEIWHKPSWILSRREMTQPSHALEISTLDLLAGRLRHLRCGRPVVFAGQEIDGAFLGIDLTDAIAGVKAAEVEVKIAVEDAIRLTRIEMPDEELSREHCTVSMYLTKVDVRVKRWLTLLTAGLLGAIIP